MEEKTLKRYAYGVVLLVGGGILLFWVWRYLVGVLIPFLVGWGFALLARPVAEKLHRGTKIPERVLRLGIVVVFLTLFSLGVWALTQRLVGEIRELIAGYEAGGVGAWEGFLARLPSWLAASLDAWVSHTEAGDVGGMVFARIGEALGTMLPALLGWLVGGIPKLVLGLVVAIISSVYFCLDLERIHRGIVYLLPPDKRGCVSQVKAGVLNTTWGFVKSYGILMGITLVILLAGLLVMRVKYALILATVISLIDVLPVLGVGTVLVPWSLFAFLLGDPGRGVGLLVVYGVVMVLRQYLEPKILGKSLGIHPLVTLICLYGGFRLGGIWGMILAPALGAVVCGVLPYGREACQDNSTTQKKPLT